MLVYKVWEWWLFWFVERMGNCFSVCVFLNGFVNVICGLRLFLVLYFFGLVVIKIFVGFFVLLM